ncbi:GNAT family N-acetyltransferase [Fulvimonas yonginensis]|uniref:GNAT family N-acetyltransferase n=1 Tax=Fulvimonas yonginensis TaxID=1495200 RepID=A0ABU8JBJ1_9GAMM
MPSGQDGQRVGFAQLRWHGAPACVAAERPGESSGCYVAGDWHGRSVAQRLKRAYLAQMRARGSDVGWLGVWERNPRAIAFCRKCGFVEVGARVFAQGRDLQRKSYGQAGAGLCSDRAPVR